jgi:hypothetical protein
MRFDNDAPESTHHFRDLGVIVVRNGRGVEEAAGV